MTGNEAQRPTTDDLLQQIDQLRKENLRLRNLLGFASLSERSSLPDEARPTTSVTQPALAQETAHTSGSSLAVQSQQSPPADLGSIFFVRQ
jgi:hypothetical protein